MATAKAKGKPPDFVPLECRYRRCGKRFMPHHGHQRYCQDSHRIEENHLRARDRIRLAISWENAQKLGATP